MSTSVADKGPHYTLIKQRLPVWLSEATWTKAQALSNVPLTLLPPLLSKPEQAHAAAKVANAHAWTTQNSVDQRLTDLQDVHRFAEPLLVDAVQKRFGLVLDVRATHLYLHIGKGWVVKGSVSRTVSLLDAALHNFAKSERFIDTSCYITRPDARGHFKIEPLHTRMSIQQFIGLCRELDLGARYQQHLREHLLPTDRHVLQAEVIASQQAALNAAVHLAWLHGTIDAATFHLLQHAAKGERGVMQFYRLQMLDTVLTGILLIAADLDRAHNVARVVAYIPNDPHGPVQVYASTLALMDALDSRLRDADYRRFFSQFVDQQQRGHFFSTLAQRLSRVHFHPRQDRFDSRPPWRETPIEHPRLRLAAVRIDGELWPFLYQRSLDKILNDGRQLAVPTADADSNARWAWWDNASKVLSELLNLALLVATPFIPLLGPAMLAYTAWQLLDEIVEGVVDLAQGQAVEAAQHLLAVFNDVAQLAAFGFAGKLAQSAFVNQLTPIEVNGKPRLWNPDPRPYVQQGLRLAPDSTPDELGLHRHEGRRILLRDGDHYALEPDAHRIQHPTRPHAYAPPLRLNDSPRAWSTQRQMRELGDFSDAQAHQIRTISGLDADQLRAIQVDSQPAPILADTVKRVRLNQQVHDMPERLRKGEPVDQDTYWSPHMAVVLEGWPRDWAIAVYEADDLTGHFSHYGATDAPHCLAISRRDLNLGKLPERLIDSVDSTQLQALLGHLPAARPARIDALRERLADALASQHGAVFDYLYQNGEHPRSAPAILVRQAFPDLPNSAVDAVIALARPTELASLTAEQRLPLRLKNIAREWQIKARAAHGFQGFYEPALLDSGAEQMVLSTLRAYSDSFVDTRIDVRRHTPRNGVRASVGPQDARHHRVLVRTDGHYEVYDAQRRLLQPSMDFYDALLHALPAPKRAELGVSDGPHLRRWLMEKLQTPEQRRTVLAPPHRAAQPPRDADVLRQTPMLPVCQWFSQLFPQTLAERVRTLYPHASSAEIEAYLGTLDAPLQQQRFEDRVVEKAQLQQDLSDWIDTTALHAPPNLRQRRLSLARTLIRAWEQNIALNGEATGLLVNGTRLTGLLDNLRLSADFSHVLHLELVDTDLLDSDTAFLANFPRLHSLNLQDNALTALPSALTEMHALTHLSLDGNPIQWTTASLAQVSDLRRLQVVSLANNRNLILSPHVGRMPALQSLSLRNTGVSDWPSGLFDHPRPSQFFLDLQNTQIERVPQFLPWLPEAEVIARARLDRNHLTRDAEQQLIGYRLAAGLDPYRSYPPRGDAAYWLEPEHESHKPWLQELWQDLEHEHGSQGFFEVIKSLEPPEFFEQEADAARYQHSRRELTSKVWRMLLAMERDEGLRTRLFTLASNPVTCADAGAHLFNAMGVEVLLAETQDARGVLRDIQLAQLARGKARLERLNQVAQADIRHRITPVDQGGLGQRFSSEIAEGLPGVVDEVEVYLAYQSGLVRRLDLPWVSEHMTYRFTAQVDDTKLNDAYARVIGLEAGDGLVDAMLEQPFWSTHLRNSHAHEFQASLDHAGELIEPLDDLMFAQNEWADASPPERETLKPRLLALADALNVPHTEVLSGAPMSASTYERLLAAQFTGEIPSEQNLARRLTHEALANLGDYDSGRGMPMEDS